MVQKFHQVPTVDFLLLLVNTLFMVFDLLLSDFVHKDLFLQLFSMPFDILCWLLSADQALVRLDLQFALLDLLLFSLLLVGLLMHFFPIPQFLLLPQDCYCILEILELPLLLICLLDHPGVKLFVGANRVELANGCLLVAVVDLLGTFHLNFSVPVVRILVDE